MCSKVYLYVLVFLSFCIFLSESIGISNKPCYTDEHLHKELEKNPDLQKGLDKVEDHWRQNVNFGGHFDKDDEGSDIERRRRLIPCKKYRQTHTDISIPVHNAYRNSFPTFETDNELNIFIFGGSGNANLFVKFGAQPTTSSYDCRPRKSGNTEECKIPERELQVGRYYVMIIARSTSGVSVSGLTLRFEWIECPPLNDPMIIPLNIHLIKGGSTPYIAYERIVSQISVLNYDFAAQNSDILQNPELYNTKIGVFKMGFILNKIIRRDTSKAVFDRDKNNMKFTANGGSNSVLSEYCLNVWVVAIDDGVLGFATFPGEYFNIDGIVIHPISFGNSKADYKNEWKSTMIYEEYSYGRVGTHEVGHWLNLKHIWGENGGGCDEDDFVSDTPTDDAPNHGCPTDNPQSCGSRDLFMNFMDYTDGDCRNMFTENQVDRADDLFYDGGFRHKMADYLESPAVAQFVAYFYFLVLNSGTSTLDPSCDPYHTLRNVNIGPQGGKNIYLCLYYSRNPFIDIMSDIKIVTGSASCPSSQYVKINTNLNQGNTAGFTSKYVCYKKASQQNPLSTNTIIDFQITRSALSNPNPVINYDTFSGVSARIVPGNMEITGEFLPNINTDSYNYDAFYIFVGLLLTILLVLNILCFVKYLCCSKNHKYQLVDKYSVETETEMPI